MWPPGIPPTWKRLIFEALQGGKGSFPPGGRQDPQKRDAPEYLGQ